MRKSNVPRVKIPVSHSAKDICPSLRTRGAWAAWGERLLRFPGASPLPQASVVPPSLALPSFRVHRAALQLGGQRGAPLPCRLAGGALDFSSRLMLFVIADIAVSFHGVLRGRFGGPWTLKINTFLPRVMRAELLAWTPSRFLHLLHKQPRKPLYPRLVRLRPRGPSRPRAPPGPQGGPQARALVVLYFCILTKAVKAEGFLPF